MFTVIWAKQTEPKTKKQEWLQDKVNLSPQSLLFWRPQQNANLDTLSLPDPWGLTAFFQMHIGSPMHYASPSRPILEQRGKNKRETLSFPGSCNQSQTCSCFCGKTRSRSDRTELPRGKHEIFSIVIPLYSSLLSCSNFLRGKKKVCLFVCIFFLLNVRCQSLFTVCGLLVCMCVCV